MKNTELRGVETLQPLVNLKMLDSIQPGGFIVVRVKTSDYDHSLAPSKDCDCWSNCFHSRKKAAPSKIPLESAEQM
jgi:hypothetical protein